MKRNGLIDQADRIERALSALDFPARIQGGSVGEGHVRYYLAPRSDAQSRQIRQLASSVAQEVGAYEVHVFESEGSMILDLALGKGDGIRLLPLLESFETPLQLTAVVGIDQHGEPVSLDFRNPKSQHLLIVGRSNSGKSEFLRTVLFSMAMWNRQTQVNFMAIDLSGNELTALEALPHGLADVASESRYGIELLLWFLDEIERREVFRIRYPELFLFVDDLNFLVEKNAAYFNLLQRVIEEGKETSVHVIAATNGSSHPLPPALSQGSGVVKAEALDISSGRADGGYSPGNFQISMNDFESRVRVAWMPAHDIQEAVSFIQSGKVRRQSLKEYIRWY